MKISRCFPAQCWVRRVQMAITDGSMLTGLVYLQPEKKSFIRMLNVVDKPLWSMNEAETRPSRQALDEIMNDLM